MQSQLPQPTQEQCKEFAQHVCYAHSWYKHIPLIEGAEFVFFFSQEAGKGYSKDKPRLHYGWKTTDEYQRRFGCLDYMYRFAGSQTFYRDSHASPVVPSDELLSCCSTVLYPYVSDDFNAQSVLSYLIAEEFLDEFRATPNHPRHREVLQWFEAEQHFEQKWQELSNSEREIFPSWDDRQQPNIAARLTELPTEVVNCMQLEIKARNLYVVLQESELDKIKSVLVRLCELSETGVQVWW